MKLIFIGMNESLTFHAYFIATSGDMYVFHFVSDISIAITHFSTSLLSYNCVMWRIMIVHNYIAQKVHI